MDPVVIEGVLTTPLKRVAVPGGDVLHALKATDPGYQRFGEAYFSLIERGIRKGWKRHREMTLNLVVPSGAVRFVVYDDRPGSSTCGQFQQVTLSAANYARLTVPPMVWMAFEGQAEGASLVLNVADMAHDPAEVDRRTLEEIRFNWSEC